MKKQLPSDEEVERALAMSRAHHPTAGIDEKQKEALAEGYKNEKCRKCGIVFLAFHHLVMCEESKCPMKQRGGKSLAEQILG